jgi:hypothetical protein
VEVKLINLDGLAVIGPGSEWFWSMLQFVIVAITLYAIYRQVRLQASSSAIEQITAFEHDWNTEGMARSRLTVLHALRDGVDPSKLPSQAAGIGNFWERIGYLVKAGHVDAALVWEYFGNTIETWWAWLAPYAASSRQQFDVPGIFENFEWIAAQMGERDRAIGQTLVFDAAYLARQLPSFIEANADAVRTAMELRSVTVREARDLPSGGP